MVTGSRMGYEYGYRLWMDKSMIERLHLCPDNIKFVFEKRTYFVVKRSDGGAGGDEIDEIFDSERDELVVRDECVGESWLHDFWHRRLQEDFWMSREEVSQLTRKVLDFARQKQKELADDDVSLPFIPVAVELDVCTVQKAGESISDAYGRAIRPQHLFPKVLRTYDNLEDKSDYLHCPLDDFKIGEFVRSRMKVHRVESVEYFVEVWMDQEAALEQRVCHLCAHKPTIGAQMVFLEDCGHCFHYNCIVEWLLKYEKSCPTCRRPITY